MTAPPVSAEITESRVLPDSIPEYPRAVETSPVRHGAQLGVARILLSPAAEELCRASVGRQPLTRYPFADAPVASGTTPVIDDDGLLWWGGAWVAIPDAQIPLARRLVARFQACVPDADLASVYPSPPGSADVESGRRRAAPARVLDWPAAASRSGGFVAAATSSTGRPDPSDSRQNPSVSLSGFCPFSVS